MATPSLTPREWAEPGGLVRLLDEARGDPDRMRSFFDQAKPALRAWTLAGWMCRLYAIRNRGDHEILFHVLVKKPGKAGTVTLKAACGPGDSGEPCVTIMLPDED